MTKPLIPQSNVLLDSIRDVLNRSHKHAAQAVNSTMVQTYWRIGHLIVEDEQQGQSRAEYGKGTLKALSLSLTKEFGKGFDVRNLRNMRSFYQTFPIRNAVRTELSWTHYRILIRIENNKARQWYMQESIEQSWSARALERQIGTLYYERLLASQADNKAIKPVLNEAKQHTDALAVSAKNYLRDPYIFDFLGLPTDSLQENELEQGLIDNLKKFLLELGKGFAFVERQQRITTDDGDYYIDLVFYNFHLKCFLLIDLKMHKLTHQDVGQMDMYVRMYEEKKRRSDDNPTIGLILCTENNKTVAKYSVLNESEQLFASKYITELPTEEELRQQLEKDRRLILEQQGKYEY
ncbi:PDDEXK nuclease domain-containing protein [Aliivibrio sp. S4TY2]|uniref:PDDEXK nuclease domain-containing protein n=1 Tax=unclassified Aliivibrio TaxID=2645654 RepID=UPI00237892F3|nr:MULTISPECIES: PDDEXK nuclease domain-containing protein [unclassified Aliivibrio]MDD9155642.1 PDDEXK nuclease domain-containing protein [Aliivibrio sp. S4TY2]MDD9160509.1 PDDEXK nuclease domain-containing protein [Aliivibrio sp. S4TY1]MDD9164593.1 PDDEXK nuclease domain-containing protein [Aliivibrio sp. S4MY2]MDD9168399.1 PDDEXK nuclease domain-containing protein [Aliivibrio sp. S4MY4]MDD9184927.1 PDDEXK nuclease domain-containing protein [Aliivibrio sp. S4MY3]